ncbi:MAG: MoxR family ATPase [Chthoniobacteraceae bacterium]
MTATSSIRFVDAIRERIGSIVIGKVVLTERLLIALLTGGHVLLRGQSGMARTLLIHAVARAIGLQFARVQFTRDLLPADLVGLELVDQAGGGGGMKAGPIFTNLLLVDQVGHAAPKVQTALLEAMLDRQVTIGSAGYLLPAPFLVIATQNPGEQEPAVQLTEAQLDRFLLCHQVEPPDVAQEEEIVRRHLALGLRIDENGGAVPKTAFDLLQEPPVATAGELVEAMKAVQQVHVSEVFTKRAVELVRRTRQHRMIEAGAGPRASIALAIAARARACIEGRDHAIPEDIYALADDVLLHRVRLKNDALAGGHTAATVLREIITDLG